MFLHLDQIEDVDALKLLNTIANDGDIRYVVDAI